MYNVVVMLPLIPVVVYLVVYLAACGVHNIIISMHAGDRGGAHGFEQRVTMRGIEDVHGFERRVR